VRQQFPGLDLARRAAADTSHQRRFAVDGAGQHDHRIA
jgi:hypothetical protein